MLYKGRNYSQQNSGLKITILKIQHVSEKYVKFKGILSNKTNGIVYETKNYKLTYEQMQNWLDIS